MELHPMAKNGLNIFVETKKDKESLVIYVGGYFLACVPVEDLSPEAIAYLKA